MEVIGAWVYDPTKNPFGDKNGTAAKFTVSCQDPAACDIHKTTGSCILAGGLGQCRFGRKSREDGPTNRSAKFRSWLSQKQVEADAVPKLQSFTTFNRIAKIGDFYYLPYSHMAKGFMSIGRYPLESEWLPASDMTPELLAAICAHRPTAWGGEEITVYQTKHLPKFISDLKSFYPDLYAMLPEAARSRVISHIGRKADITTCQPGRYKIGTEFWDWDGKQLTGGKMLFQPAPGKCEIIITPDARSPVQITDDSQVGPETVFLD